MDQWIIYALQPKMTISLLRKRWSVANERIKSGDGLFNILVRRSIPIPPAVLLPVLIVVWCSSTFVSDSFFHVCISSRKLDVHCFSAGTRPEFRGFRVQDEKLGDNGGSNYNNGNGGENNSNKNTNGGDNNGDGDGDTAATATNVNNSSGSEDHDADQNNNSTNSYSNGSGGSSRSENGGSKSRSNDGDETGDKSVDDIEQSAMNNHSINIRNSSLSDEIAIAVHAVEEKMQSLRCPSNRTKTCDGRGIFVYDLPAKFNQDLMSQCGDMLPWMNFCKYFTHDAMGKPIPKLGKGGYNTHQYSLEPIFHSEVLKHPCRVNNPNEAKLFYVPFYGGLDILRWHFKNVSTDVKDQLGLDLIKWLEAQPTWARHAGSDHVFVLGKISWDFRRNDNFSWGTNFLELNEMQNPYKLLIERQPWHGNDVGIPHPTHFHPHSDDDIIAWQSKIMQSNRKNLISFAGAARPEAANNIRSVLINQCKSSDGYCRFLDCKAGGCRKPESVIKLFMESEFCLQPPGDSPTRKSLFDSLVSGCIPVLFDPFTAYYQYPWHLPEDYRRYSIFVDKEEVREMKVDVVERLRTVTPEEREEMRRYIVYELMPRLVYGDSNSEFVKFDDAFTISMDNLLHLVNRQSQLL